VGESLQLPITARLLEIWIDDAEKRGCYVFEVRCDAGATGITTSLRS
jgi:hypothetical protein